MKKFVTSVFAMLLGCLFCAAEGNFVRVYCYCVQDWWTTDGAAIGFYVYGDGDAINAAWPGELMQQVDGQEGLWTAEVDNSVYSSLIFTRVSPEGAEWGAQTANLTIPTDSMNVYRITSVSGVWSPESVEGYWTSLSQINTGSVVEDEANYYLIGSTEELGSWDLANALPMEGGAISLELSEGSYTFKVLPQRDSWDNVLGYSNLSHGCSSAGVRGDGDENISITMSEAGMITVSVTDNIICVTGNFINTGNSVYLTTGVTPTNCGGYAYPLSGEYTIGASVELEANISIGGWMFDKWSDNESWDNPRTITLTQDTTITAIFSPGEYGILVNGNRLYRGTFTERLEGSYVAQFLANVRMNEGDYFQIINIFHSDNTRWSPQLEEGGLSGNFTAQDGSIRCNTTGCYDMYIKIHYGQSDDYVYIGGGSDCPEGEEVDFGGGTSANRVYSLVGTDNLFATAWDTGDSLTEMTLVGDGMYQYTIDSVTLIPEGDYQYKVIANHAWNIEEYPSVQEDDNYHITVEQSGVYMVLFSFQPGVGCNATTMYLHEINNDAPEIVASGYCAEDGTMSVSWLLSSDSILTIGGNGAMADYNEETVIAPWYEYRDAYHSVYIAAGVTNVGNLAFQQSANLRYVDLASTVTSLGNYSFYNCPALHELSLPESVMSVGDNTPFGGSTAITSAVYNSQVFVRLPQDYTGEYTVEEGTTVIASDAFKRCNMLSSVVLPSTVTTFAGSSTFEECSALATVNIPEGVTSLGFYMFSGCSSLRYIELPSSVASLGSYCFGECSSVESVICRSTTPPEANGSTFAGVSDTVPVYVPSASLARYREADGWSSFSNYHGINDDPQSCVIASGTCGVDGDNLTWVFDCDSTLTISGKGRMAFYGEGAPYTPWKGYMNDIKKLVVEDSVTYISDYTCLRAEKLKEVIIGEGVTRIGHGAFCTCNNLERVLLPSTVDTIEEQTFQSCVKLKYIELPAPMKYIGGWAFYYCYLDSIKCYATTPPVLADNAFEGVSTSTPVFVPDISLSTYRKADVWSSFSNFRALPACVTDSGYCGANDNNLTWKMYCDSVLAIMGTGAMSEYSGSSSVPWHEHAANIREAVVGEGVTSLSTSAFEGCSKLTTVTLPEGLTSIGMYAFSNCTSLKGIDLPATTTSIGSYCFGECPNMDSITCRATIPPAANGSTFAGVDVTIPLYVPARSISKYRAADGWSSFSDIRAVPVCVRDSGTCGVDGDNLTWTLTCDGLLTISGTGRMAFYGEGAPNTPWKEYMNDIKKLVVEDGVTYISDYTCLRAGTLKEVIIGEGVTRIGHGAFCTCNNLERVVLPSTVDTIEEQTFQSCVKLKYIELPAPMKYICGWAFYYCYFDSIKCYATTPPVLADNAFEGVSTSIPVFVPYRSAVAYRSDAGWSRFSNINEMPECLIASGECGAQGDNVTWKLSCDSVLTISGTGAMANYTTNSNGQAPWAAYGLQIRDIVIEEGVTTISAYGFYNAGSYTDGAYNNVRNVSIPSTVSKLENNYFYQCPIEYVSINSDSIVGKGSFSSGSSLHRIFGAQVREYYIGNNVKSIANSAFYNQGADSLAYITLPEGLESIGTWAFGYIEHLTFITIPDSVQTIGSDAFAGCENLESVVLGESLTRIDGQAFWMCDNLTQVSCYAMNPPTLNSTSFDHYDTLIVRCEAKSLYQEADYWKNFTPILCPDDTTGSYVEPDAPEQITFALDSSWKFIMLPTILGLQADNIVVDGEIAWAVYNGEERAAGRSGWQGFNPINGFTDIQACIVRARNGSATLTLNLPEQVRERASAELSANYFPAAHEQNANWNFLGNPYPFRYDIMSALENANISSPIAVWNGIAYDFYTPGLDEYVLQPFESFFIQLPANGPTSIPFSAEYTLGD